MSDFMDVKYEKIIWALDPKQDPEEARELIQSLKAWSQSLVCQIQPVSVFSKTFFEYPFDLALFGGQKSLRKVAHEIVERYLKDIGGMDILPPAVLFSKDISNRQMAVTLSRYAEKTKGALIFAHTREKKTRSPIRIGGFTEALIATSRAPVFCLNPSAGTVGKRSAILFATDFSAESKIALQRLGPIAKAFHSKVILYNQVEFPKFYLPAYEGYFPAYDWERLMGEIETERKSNAEEWRAELERHQIKCEAIVRHRQRSISSSILEIADESKAQLIIMASHSTPWTQALLGGTPRDVMLQAKCPVLIFHHPKVIRAPKVKVEVVSVQRTARQKESGQMVAL